MPCVRISPMNERQRIPFLIASSVAADFPPPHRFSLQKTIEIAKGRADGTPFYFNPERFVPEDIDHDDVGKLRDMLAKGGLVVNVVHLPGYAIPKDLKGKSRQAMSIASGLVDPIPDVGKLCVIHHDPFSTVSDSETVDTTSRVLDALGDSEIAIGLEHFHPFNQTTQANLAEQVDRYIELLGKMREQVPTFAVFDIGRFYTPDNANIPPAPLTDNDNQLVEKMCAAVAGQRVLVHAIDKKSMDRSFREQGNAVPLGTGVLTPIYRQMFLTGEKHHIQWIGVVNEIETVGAISNKEAIQELLI